MRESSLSTSLLRKYRLVPLGDDGTTLEVGGVGGVPPDVIEELSFLTGRTVVGRDVDADTVTSFLGSLDADASNASPESPALPQPDLYGDGATRSVSPSPPQNDQPRSPSRSSLRSVSDTPENPSLRTGSVVRQVDRIISRAIAQEASDIHIEPYESFFRVRFRRDGVLHTAGTLDLRQRDAITSRLKIMADLDIAEKRRPQDSRIRVEHDGRDVDLRVSTLPTAHGEKVVLRILDKNALDLNLTALGLSERDRTLLDDALRCPTGQILVTGPTGSGKTTTLYAALSSLNTDAVNITTIEDPVEYNLSGINQTRVRSDIGFTFARALRSFLRQDPNVIMVGEIRDTETARIAVRAALTGHLVLSTLHTNDAPSTVTRLVDMGVEPYLVAASVRLIVAQRLVRCVCPQCKREATGDAVMLERLGIEPGHPVASADGCDACSGTGFQGRTALFEIMPVSESIGERVTDGASTYDVRREAVDEGLRTLRDAGADAVRTGLTTPEEALREIAA